MKTGRYYNLIWEKGDTTIETGIKGGGRPNKAIAGGFGTYRTRIPAEVILFLITESGETLAYNIIATIRSVTGRTNMSEKLINNIIREFEGQTFEIGNNGGITNLRDILENVKS